MRATIKPMRPEILLFDLLGTCTFAFYGAYMGIGRKFDIFGIFTVAFLTAVGGGTIREILLNHLPAYFTDMRYIAAIALGMGLAMLAYPVFTKINKYALVIDAIGLVSFAFIGAERALAAGLGAFGIIALATITAVGGGLLRDIAIAETPQIFYQDFYASPAIVVGILCVIFAGSLANPTVIYTILACGFLIRLAAIYFKINLWGPWRKSKS